MNFVEDGQSKTEAVGGHVCYPSHCWGQLLDKKQVKEERTYFSSQFEGILPIVARKVWHLEGESAGHIVSAGRKQRTDRKWGLTIRPQGQPQWFTNIGETFHMQTTAQDNLVLWTEHKAGEGQAQCSSLGLCHVYDVL